MATLQQQLEAEFEKAVEADDNKTAQLILDRIDALKGEKPADEPEMSAEAIGLEPTVAKEATAMSEATESITITKDALGVGEFTPVLAQLSPEQIGKLMVDVVGTDDLMALIVPGTSVVDADHRIHLEQRGDVKRAARGLAITAAGGVDMDSQVILSNSGRAYTITDGECLELQKTEQPNFDGSITTIKKDVACKGHLEYRKDPSTDRFVLTGEQHLRCLHQWALMFEFGFFVTASKKVYAEVARAEIGQRVGDDTARSEAKATIDSWVANSSQRREVRTGFAQAINARKSELGLAEGSFLPPQNEIGGYQLPDGKTVSQAITDLRGRQFALKVELPMNGKAIEITTRTVKNLQELASVVAPHFAVARQNEGELVVLDLLAR